MTSEINGADVALEADSYDAAKTVASRGTRTLKSIRAARITPKRVRASLRAQQTAIYRTRSLRPQVLYESYFGQGALCSPEQIFRELISRSEHANLRHVWPLKDDESAQKLRAEFADDSRVTFVRHGSAAYRKALSRSKYVINNSTFGPAFSKRTDQIYINTWHGTPLKQMGYDVPRGGPTSSNVLRNFLSADYLVSPNRFTTDTMLRGAYRLDGIFRGKILETGYPRADLTYRLSQDPKTARDWIAEYGIELPAGRRTVLIAPTWKGDSYYAPQNDAEDLADLVAALQSQLGDEYFVIVKPHQRVAHFAQEYPELKGRLIPPDVPTNGVLACADFVVTDYSSIFYDYLVTGRPILFYVPDAQDYDEYRGLYRDPANLPGPLVEDADELAEWILDSDNGGAKDWNERYREAHARDRATYAPFDDGQAAARVVDAVFSGRPDAEYVIEDIWDNGKQSLLIFLGGLLPNGITSSAFNLLHNIDYERFDVTVTYPQYRVSRPRDAEYEIDTRARLAPLMPGVAPQPLAGPLRNVFHGRVLPGEDPLTVGTLRKAFRAEWERLFGNSKFDHAVDFSGYSARPPAILRAGDARTYSMWMHNDLAADRNRTVAGSKPHADNLSQAFRLYGLFDNLVSVSPALCEINRRNLARYSGDARFAAAVNTLDAQRIDDATDDPATEVTPLSGTPLTLATRRARTGALINRASGPTFVTVGRLSPEKNHKRLLRAFHSLGPNAIDATLVIVGDGPLMGELKSLTRELGLGRRVHFVGQTQNPFIYLRAADCFVLSSDYEGQPMVILEARHVGLPVVVTRFGSAESAVPEGTGLIVDSTVAALAAGMNDFVEGRVPRAVFDAAAYNADAIAQFYNAIGATNDAGTAAVAE